MIANGKLHHLLAHRPVSIGHRHAISGTSTPTIHSSSTTMAGTTIYAKSATYKNGKLQQFHGAGVAHRRGWQLSRGGSVALRRHHLHRLRSCVEGICSHLRCRKSCRCIPRDSGQQSSRQLYSGDPQAGGVLLTTYHTDVDVQAGERIERTVTIPETAMTSIWMIVNTDKYPIVVSGHVVL